MTIAVTPFDGLCGFRPLAEITHFLQHIPSFRKLVGEEEAKNFENTVKGQETSSDPKVAEANKKALQSAFTKLMNTSKDALESATEELIKAAQSEGASFAGEGGPSNSGQELADLVVRLNDQFPKDIGLFVQFFLNYVKLEVGEAMFLRADDIHAYLSGDIIECMASSDNVVRAGFTPKFKDVDTLTSMLTYSYAPIQAQKMVPGEYTHATMNATAYSSQSSLKLYSPEEIREFSVLRAALNKTGAKITFDHIKGPSIILATKGKGTISLAGNHKQAIEEGYVFFAGSETEVVVESETDADDSGEGLVLFKAFCDPDDETKKRD